MIKNNEYYGISKIEKWLWYLFIILIPIGYLPYFNSYLGEIAYVPSLYILILLIFTVVTKTTLGGKILWPKSLVFNIFTLFCLLAVMSSLLSVHFIPVVYLKGEVLGVKSLKQIFLLFLCWFTIYYVLCLSIMHRQSIINTIKLLYWVSIGVVVYGIFQLIALRNPLSQISNLITSVEKLISLNVYIWGEPYISHFGRLNLTTMEASTAGDLLLVVCIPCFLFVLFSTKSKVYKLLSLLNVSLAVVLLYFTQSKSGYLIALLMLPLVVAFYYRKLNKQYLTKFIVIITLLSVILYAGTNTSILENVSKLADTNLSNTSSMSTRYGSMITSLNICFHYPLGVGLGNTGFVFEKNMPSELINNQEIQGYITGNFWLDGKSFWFRLLAETGYIGFSVFIGMFILLIYRLLIVMQKCRNEELKDLVVFVLVSLFVISLEGFNISTLRNIHWFLIIGIAMAVDSIYQHEIVPERSTLVE